jgi:hypothetical protein
MAKKGWRSISNPSACLAKDGGSKSKRRGIAHPARSEAEEGWGDLLLARGVKPLRIFIDPLHGL